MGLGAFPVDRDTDDCHMLAGLSKVYPLVEVSQRRFLRRHFGYARGDADPSVRREQAVLMVRYLCRRWSASCREARPTVVTAASANL
jgi:hypothetical protein